jgi:hypothetical protein
VKPNAGKLLEQLEASPRENWNDVTTEEGKATQDLQYPKGVEKANELEP